jgi:acetate kinase
MDRRRMANDELPKVLIFNTGSNSLKFEVVVPQSPSPHLVQGRKLPSGVVEPIGEGAKLSLLENHRKTDSSDVAVENHAAAVKEILNRIDGIGDIPLVGHRVVHGADRYVEPTIIDDDVISGIEELDELAPLHNASAAAVIRASRAAFDRSIPQVAVFDTAFHRTIPDHARYYALPWEITKRYGIQRFGFHGISHNYLALRYAELTRTPLERTNIITLHLEGGSSATAVLGGESIDTSMGFTPLEGLMMGTRSGDLDPALVGFLARKENIAVDEVESLLNKKSGLRGVSGTSADTRELVKDHGDRANLALEMFAYRVRKYIGAYLAAMNGASAVVFGGGIGEDTHEVRRRICRNLEHLGLEFDEDQNMKVVDREGEITRSGSPLRAFVIPTEEGMMIAHQAWLHHGKAKSLPRQL